MEMRSSVVECVSHLVTTTTTTAQTVMSTREPKKRVTRKKKDPNAPKRSMSAYMFFANENRDIVKSENPNATFGQLGKLLGEKWKNMSTEDKEPYDAKAAADKKRYESEKELYNATKEK
ncbi:high-mobility group nucleosome-binding protein KNAG_0H00800 [Huiozyma naganishii CBS 8797]|uniref:HMG box domain-containing protein n=1 Tax=Huiozyma naganishii (strain ATCC MYA-139 / BCRC 22969 / CBS 8797 / KCTC 17520 / NBRC 10181 / NCYC 3082 / Yp74L-3) TaxID=1071383 RepID=J7R9H1_HUIN7|nr:hypothetical protein KNAG_0H00800 [Kazachstania naganishii CBS 8797]CCK71495.1 hypothetical protein KNAG_0H00800 [Kazachstania naganishii CBS 8797]